MEFKEYYLNDSKLPSPLTHIPDRPKELFWAGSSLDPLLAKPRVAIVGSRKVTAYGRHVTYQLARELAEYGVVVISGLALGVDSIAHSGALEGGGKTIAVLPCSLDKIYPASNTGLARRIVRHGGCLVSEYPRGSPFAFKYNFVARNRIIAGLSDAVLITEAAVDSGSLHTADFALQQGREVLVVPGNITSPTSAGTNNLLKMGATPVTSVVDVLRVLGIEPETVKMKLKSKVPEEQMILDLVQDGMHDGDRLLNHSGLTATEFNQALTMLEINGLIRPGGGNTWL